MITLFGKNINPGNINQEQKNTLNEYMASLGYIANYEIERNQDNIPTNVNITFDKYSL